MKGKLQGQTLIPSGIYADTFDFMCQVLPIHLRELWVDLKAMLVFVQLKALKNKNWTAQKQPALPETMPPTLRIIQRKDF